MARLDEFLDRASAAGARFRQDFPPDCLPIREGNIVRPIDSFVSSIEESTTP
jgi:peptidoglycan-N-acetylglucosamine deacetylase